MTTVDQQRAEAFAGQMLGALNNTATVLMLSIGHRTRLFQAMSKLPAATSGGIDKATGARGALRSRVTGQYGREPDRRLRSGQA